MVVIHSLAVYVVPGRVTPENPEGADVIVLVIVAVLLIELLPLVELAAVFPLALSVPEALWRSADVLATEVPITVVGLRVVIPFEVVLELVDTLAVITELDSVVKPLEGADAAEEDSELVVLVIKKDEEDPKLVAPVVDGITDRVVAKVEGETGPVVEFALDTTVELAIVVGPAILNVNAEVLMLALPDFPGVELFPGKTDGCAIGSPFEAVGIVQPIPLGPIS